MDGFTDGVELNYQIEAGVEHPEKQAQYWDYSEQLVATGQIPGAGITGG